MQQVIEMLAKAEDDRKADKEEKLTRMETLTDAYHEKRMAMFDAYEKRMMACIGQTEANTEETEQDPGMIQSVESIRISLLKTSQ
jgi:signal transduction protein with GAF and PtsI domain